MIRGSSSIEDTFFFAASTAAFSSGSSMASSVSTSSVSSEISADVSVADSSLFPWLWSTHPQREALTRHRIDVKQSLLTILLLIFIIVFTSAPSAPVFTEIIYDTSPHGH